jgi:hypothetical protein
MHLQHKKWLCPAVLMVGLLVNLQPTTFELQPLASSNIAHVWANEGGDKVWRSELRATDDPNAVLNSVWDGMGISLFGARNEVVAFNLVLEAPTASATNVNVSLTSLTGPGGATITTTIASGDSLFNYVGRNIELFYVRYLEIKGLSVDLAYNDYDERHIPERCRRPYDEGGIGMGTWDDRPCHNQLYPEIAVPLEFHTPFTITAGTSQSIWGDIYIPKTVPAGNYIGTVEVREDGELTWQIPISLRVRNFTLPDMPNAKTMVYYSSENINDRYLGEDNMNPDPGTSEYTQSIELIDRHFQLAHRHKVSLINSETDIERMDDAWTSRLNGETFTPAQGYDGVGIGVGNGVYSIGTYGSWSWQDGSEADMWANTDPWVNWFDAQAFVTPTDYFLYLTDESDDYPQIEQWAQWMDNNPGPGQRLMSMATISLPDAMANTPSLDIPTSGAGVGITSEWENALASLRANPSKRFFMYNGNRPGSGSFATEDEGVSLRELAWGHYKKEVELWFYWESTYYVNFQCYGYHDPKTYTNVFQQAQTFGCYSYDDDSRGEAGWNYFNGDGVLFYPGTDTRFPDESYGAPGPFASLRLKLWRRGIQDVDYLTLAAMVNPTRTAEIVNEMVPKVLWEYGVEDPGDPTWVLTDISWSTNPDDWEAARAELADIIESAPPTPTPAPTPTPEAIHIDSTPFLFCYPGETSELPDALTNIGLDGLDIVTTVWGTVDGQWASYNVEIEAGNLRELVNSRPYVMTHQDGVCNDWEFTSPPSPIPTPTPNNIHIDSNPFLFCYPGPDCDLPEALTNIGPDGLNIVTTVWGTAEVEGTWQWISYDAEIGAGNLRELVNSRPYVVTHQDGVCNDWDMPQ